MRCLSNLVLVLAMTASVALSGQSLTTASIFREPSGFERVWDFHCGMARAFDGNNYVFVDETGNVKLDLSEYKMAYDFNRNLAVVQSKSGLYGLINKSGKLVLDTAWQEIRNVGFGYLQVAEKSVETVMEDRGKGLKSYTMKEWRLLDQQLRVLPMKCKEITQILNIAVIETWEGDNLYLDLNGVNYGFYNPLLKALKKVNGISVKPKVNTLEKMIEYFAEGHSEPIYQLDFEEVPKKLASL